MTDTRAATISFEARLGSTAVLVLEIERLFSGDPNASKRLKTVGIGYERTTPNNVRNRLRFVRTDTVTFLRFLPDCLLVDLEIPDRSCLIDFKVTQTPLYSERRIRHLAEESGVAHLDAQRIGQIEADAFFNYQRIAGLGVRVAVLNYCAYHSRFLLCEYVERIQVLGRFERERETTTGSGTPFINFDCNSMRTLDEFVRDEHGFTLDPKSYAHSCDLLGKRLPVTHHKSSPQSGQARSSER